MTNSGDTNSDRVRAKVLRAAFEELLDRGIDRFSVAGVAKRADVDLDVITTMWHDRRILLMDALLSSSESSIPIPDTGTLRGDLMLSAESAAGQYPVEAVAIR